MTPDHRRQKALRFLRRLGDTPEAIANALRRRGIKGRPGTCNACPLAVALNKELPGSGWGVGEHAFYEMAWPEGWVGSMRPVATEFVQLFDRMRWPELVEEGYAVR